MHPSENAPEGLQRACDRGIMSIKGGGCSLDALPHLSRRVALRALLFLALSDSFEKCLRNFAFLLIPHVGFQDSLDYEHFFFVQE